MALKISNKNRKKIVVEKKEEVQIIDTINHFRSSEFKIVKDIQDDQKEENLVTEEIVAIEEIVEKSSFCHYKWILAVIIITVIVL